MFLINDVGGYDFYGQQQYGNRPPVQQQFGGQYPQQPYGGSSVPAPPVVVVNTPLEVGRGPVSVSCPACKAHVTTHVTVETGDLAWVGAAFLCFLSCCLIAWVPFCMDSLKVRTVDLTGEILQWRDDIYIYRMQLTDVPTVTQS